MSELRDASGAVEQLGREIERRSGPRPGARRTQDLSGSEVHQDQAAVARAAHHVLRLHVAVNDARVVHRRQRPAQVLSPSQRLAGAARPLAVDRVVQRRAFDEIHPEAEPAAVHVGAVHHHHVEMPHAHQHAGFLQHAGPVADVGLQQLQGHVVAQPEIAREEHFAKHALADLLDQLEVAPPCAGRDIELAPDGGWSLVRLAGGGDGAVSARRGSRSSGSSLVDLRAMDVGNTRQNLQFGEELRDGRVLMLGGQPPTVEGTIRDGLDQVLQADRRRPSRAIPRRANLTPVTAVSAVTGTVQL